MYYGLYCSSNINIFSYYLCAYNNEGPGILDDSDTLVNHYYAGMVKNNTYNAAGDAGVKFLSCHRALLAYSAVNDNLNNGIRCQYGGGFYGVVNNFGSGNGTWGTYAIDNAGVKAIGTECSGSSGNHSDPGTAGNPSADQAVVYT
jgi:hypothetical protein